MPFVYRGYYDEEFKIPFYQCSMRNPVYMASLLYLGTRNAEIEELIIEKQIGKISYAIQNVVSDDIRQIRKSLKRLRRHKRGLIAATLEFFKGLGIDPTTIKSDLKEFPRIAALLPQYRIRLFVREENPSRYELQYDYNQESPDVINLTYNRFPQPVTGLNDSPIKENAMFNLTV